MPNNEIFKMLEIKNEKLKVTKSKNKIELTYQDLNEKKICTLFVI